jgi:ribonuclease T1
LAAPSVADAGRARPRIRLRILVSLATALLLTLLTALYAAPARQQDAEHGGSDAVRLADLPEQARDTLALIRRGGPFPYGKDGTVFANREGRLPSAPRGTYREYTVRTPGLSSRGARRIVTGNPGTFYYTDDHYRSFRRIRE